MKAMSFDGKQMKYDENYPDPKPGESLVRVSLAGICGTDLEILDGYMQYNGVLGHEFVGIVEKSQNPDLVGKRVVGEINVGCNKCDSCKKGMQRHCPNRTVLGILKRDGAFAEFLSLPEENLHVIPDSITDEQAVFVEPLAAAFEIKEQVSLNSDWKVAVVGDGRLAQMICQVLKLSCPDVACFGRHETKLAHLEKFEIKTRIGITPSDSQSYDLVVEATGSNSGFADTMKLVKPRGTVILKSTIASRENLDLTPTVVNEITLIGSRCGLFKPAIDALVTGIVSVDSMIDSTFPLEKFTDAINHAKKPDTLKVFLKP
ncbi:2-deoxy-scyllo-inosamine dehydrogenase protein [Marine Group I thaumarchaeote SCGC AAA799-E16]|uniref:2-deoxy-scyllo-inosamine dehydrogenase protein n=4 Tax=Marine Group I TaxID=905826 RepID=A0A081RM14_9ARCH|nr:2-deoxy-scyllo-inosamine dehydrogenase protein [Marine Group I thaumarchaeote SCGC AAA799-N04]KER06350.1 2-deoxy-scyllo-inosamine dehydrogenase protein [Marine Group I thaumarchaeote SCGC AAA799-E16]KFM17236.1 2-deoxy-scyllo-inosamine dehydrogenase protein [Marine Group I thaumarchaeote SCGC AAA799-D11]KFM19093.1 2-deoxy-scyllo-inosamine dehydrogenase protein [Marine Group I thaumarchaeote SCGC RSA3]